MKPKTLNDMINVAKLLKDAPKGMKLYSPLLGEVEFAEVMDTGYMPIRVMKRGYGLRFDKYGRYMGNEYPDAECLLFPSKEVRTWEGWKLPAQPKFKVGDWITCVDDDGDTSTEMIEDFWGDKVRLIDCDGVFTLYPKSELKQYRLWTLADVKDGDVLCTYECGEPKIVFIHKLIRKNGSNIFMYYCFYNIMHPRFDDANDEPGCLAPKREDVKPATKEQCDLLFDKMKEAGYEWDADKNELRKIQPHYDVSNFYAGMTVLVRPDNDCAWDYSVFSRITGNEYWKFSVCNGVSFTQCIPFNEKTKHLLGTADMPSEEFINW